MTAADTQWFQMASLLGEVYEGSDVDVRLTDTLPQEEIEDEGIVILKARKADGDVDPWAIPVYDDDQELDLPVMDLERMNEEQLRALAQAISPQPASAVA